MWNRERKMEGGREEGKEGGWTERQGRFKGEAAPQRADSWGERWDNESSLLPTCYWGRLNRPKANVWIKTSAKSWTLHFDSTDHRLLHRTNLCLQVVLVGYSCSLRTVWLWGAAPPTSGLVIKAKNTNLNISKRLFMEEGGCFYVHVGTIKCLTSVSDASGMSGF